MTQLNPTFQPGSTYSTRSICDHNCVFSFKVLSRTAKMVTLEYQGKTIVRALRLDAGVEYCMPLGHYSMAPVLRADKDAEAVEQNPTLAQLIGAEEVVSERGVAIKVNGTGTLGEILGRNRDGDPIEKRGMFVAAAMALTTVWDAWDDESESQLDDALQSAAGHCATLVRCFPDAVTVEERVAFEDAVLVITSDPNEPPDNVPDLTFDQALEPLRAFVRRNTR